MNTNAKIIEIDDMNTYAGGIPVGYELVCYDKGTDPVNGLCLYGFDEVGMFDDNFKETAYCFLNLSV
jgi:hypothetical protein